MNGSGGGVRGASLGGAAKHGCLHAPPGVGAAAADPGRVPGAQPDRIVFPGLVFGEEVIPRSYHPQSLLREYHDRGPDPVLCSIVNGHRKVHTLGEPPRRERSDWSGGSRWDRDTLHDAASPFPAGSAETAREAVG